MIELITLDRNEQCLKWNQRRIKVDRTEFTINSGPKINLFVKMESIQN